MRTRIYIAISGIAFLIILGCTGPEGLDALFDNNGGACLDDPLDIEGTWVITGSGQRNGCADDALNTDHFELKSPGLKLAATTDSFGNIQFDLAQAIDGFELEGAVDCQDAVFTTRESFRGSEINHVFSGESKSNGDISGTFTVSGPDACTGTGSFLMTRQ